MKFPDAAAPGLFLQISASGTKSWLVRVRQPGDKPRDRGLGSVQHVPLADARRLAGEFRARAASGLAVTGTRKAARQAREAEAKALADATDAAKADASRTFQAMAESYIAGRERTWKNDKHRAQWTATLRHYAWPVIGARDVASLTATDALAVLQPIWHTVPETAQRLRQRCEAVVDAAIARGHSGAANPFRWKGALANLLPARAQVRKVRHQPALPWQQVPAFLTALGAARGQGADMLHLAILCASRSGEVRAARWSEFDLEAAIWTIPASRMKANQRHAVPLSEPALDLLRRVRGTGSLPDATALVFSSTRNTVPSDMTLLQVVRRLNGVAKPKPGAEPPRWVDHDGEPVVPHGFRASFKNWSLASGWPDHLSELALAHTDQNAVRAAYARDDLLEARRPMMAAWGDFCTGRAGVVVPLATAVRGAA